MVYLFSRSKIARELIEMNIQDLMKLTLGYGGERYKLPPPLHIAKQLQEQSLQNLRDWSQAHPNLLRLATTERFLTNQVHPLLPLPFVPVISGLISDVRFFQLSP